MKTNNLLFILLFFICFSGIAQTYTFTGDGSNNHWRNAVNWDPIGVPGVNSDVILPDGSSSAIKAFADPSDTLAVRSITMFGDAQLNVEGRWGVVDTNSDIQPNAIINWSAGAFGGGGTLNNSGTLNITSVSTHEMGGGSSSIVNSGTINLFDGGSFIVQGTLHNTEDGLVDFREETLIGGDGLFINEGTIRSIATFEDVAILVPLENTNGTIFSAGSDARIILNNPGTYTNGTFNTVQTGVIEFIGDPITVSGFLQGEIQGAGSIEWTAPMIVPTTASFNFEGEGIVAWNQATLGGGGTFTNRGTIHTRGGNKAIIDNTTFNNEGILKLAHVLTITDGTLFNKEEGVIELDGTNFQIGAGGAGAENRIIINEGLILRTSGFLTNIFPELYNAGVIDIEQGEIIKNSILPFTNAFNGTVKGNGIFDFTANSNFVNNGTYAPGSSPGTLTYQGNFDSESSSVLEVDLDGNTQGSEYDLLEIQGNADFKGTIDVNLQFNPEIDDEFVIATTTGTITNCALPATVEGRFGTSTYTFSVFCRNDNELVLTADSVVLGTEENDFANSIVVYPNPVNNVLNIQNNSLSEIDVIAVFDVNGRLILKELENLKSNAELDLSELTTGMYFVEISSSEGTITKRIIKK